MKKILLIQSRTTPHRILEEQEAYRRSLSGVAEVEAESALNAAREWEDHSELLKGFDGVMFGGSGDFDFHGGRSEDDAARATSREILERLRPFVASLLESDFPILGVCYGHQILAELYGGGVSNDLEQNKVGTHEVSLTEEGERDPLFKTLPKRFDAQYAHKDSVTSLPAGSTLLATGSSCKFSALRYGPRAYTMQFHPEETKSDMLAGLSNAPGYTPEGVSIESIVRESPEASTLLSRWVEIIVK
jgi:GMP synthase-like glutamine amidotransferase